MKKLRFFIKLAFGVDRLLESFENFRIEKGEKLVKLGGPHFVLPIRDFTTKKLLVQQHIVYHLAGLILEQMQNSDRVVQGEQGRV